MVKVFTIEELQSIIGPKESLHGTLDTLVREGFLSGYEFCFSNETVSLEISTSAEVQDIFEGLYGMTQAKKKGVS